MAHVKGATTTAKFNTNGVYRQVLTDWTTMSVLEKLQNVSADWNNCVQDFVGIDSSAISHYTVTLKQIIESSQ